MYLISGIWFTLSSHTHQLSHIDYYTSSTFILPSSNLLPARPALFLSSSSSPIINPSLSTTNNLIRVDILLPTSGNHTGSDENVWICEHCDFRNEQKAERCELCLEAPSISRKVLQLGKQHIASLKKNNSSSRGTNILSPSQNRSKLKKQLLKGKHTSKQKKKQKRHTLI